MSRPYHASAVGAGAQHLRDAQEGGEIERERERGRREGVRKEEEEKGGRLDLFGLCSESK